MAAQSWTTAACGIIELFISIMAYALNFPEIAVACFSYHAGMLAGLRALREAGRIDEVSLGMNMVVAPQILRLLREAPEGTFDNIMLAHGWNLLCHDGLEVVQECSARGMNRACRQRFRTI